MGESWNTKEVKIVLKLFLVMEYAHSMLSKYTMCKYYLKAHFLFKNNITFIYWYVVNISSNRIKMHKNIIDAKQIKVGGLINSKFQN